MELEALTSIGMNFCSKKFDLRDFLLHLGYEDSQVERMILAEGLAESNPELSESIKQGIIDEINEKNERIQKEIERISSKSEKFMDHINKEENAGTIDNNC